MRPLFLHQQGFTLVEMMVSLAIFAIVVTTSVGTLLVLIGSNQQLQEEQATMSNLSFALDSMARDIRTGTDYYCDSGTFATHNSIGEGQDCKNGDSGISFVESGGSLTQLVPGAVRVAFYFDNETIYRRIGNAAPEQILSSDIKVHAGRFIVSGSERMSDGESPLDQPSVTMFINASQQDVDDCGDPGARCINVQTSVTQRVLDL